MLASIVVVLLSLHAGGSPSQRPATASAQTPAEIVQIDGKRTPEAIPAWVAWGSALKLIGRTVGNKSSALADVVASDLALDESDLRLVQAAAGDHLERDARAQEWSRRWAQDPPKTEAARARYRQAVRAYETEFRLELLAAADELLAALSPEGRLSVQEFVEKHKKGMVLTVLKAELDWFRWPR